MLEFKKPELKDKEWVDECFSHSNSFNCEYTFGNLYVWSTAYSTLICRYKDFFICKWGRGEDISYSLPIGKGNFKDAILEIINDAKNYGVAPLIYGVTPLYKSMLEENFPDCFEYITDDGFNDYIYLTEKMASLSGKKYHSKRNHITNFKKNYPNWSFEIINKDNIADCITLHTQWIKDREDSDDDADYSYEFEAVLSAFENYDKLGFIGGLLRIDDKPIAYTFGERQCDELFVTHFEKAPADVQGAYAIINQEFTKNCLMDYKYVNREEDLGLEGLRRAKMSYNPEIILKKSVAKNVK